MMSDGMFFGSLVLGALLFIAALVAGIVWLGTSNGHYLVTVPQASGQNLVYHAKQITCVDAKHLHLVTEDGRGVDCFGSFIVETVVNAEAK